MKYQHTGIEFQNLEFWAIFWPDIRYCGQWQHITNNTWEAKKVTEAQIDKLTNEHDEHLVDHYPNHHNLPNIIKVITADIIKHKVWFFHNIWFEICKYTLDYKSKYVNTC